MTETIPAILRTFIVENFLFGDTTQSLTDHMSLIENQIVDSTGILELVAYLEDRFGITVADAEIVPDNLDSIERLCIYIARKTGTAVEAA